MWIDVSLQAVVYRGVEVEYLHKSYYCEDGDEYFTTTEMDEENLNTMQSKLPRSKDYTCPNCGEPHIDNDIGYIVDSKEYPIISNETRGYILDGIYLDWDEVHACMECNQKYWFRNGAY